MRKAAFIVMAGIVACGSFRGTDPAAVADDAGAADSGTGTSSSSSSSGSTADAGGDATPAEPSCKDTVTSIEAEADTYFSDVSTCTDAGSPANGAKSFMRVLTRAGELDKALVRFNLAAIVGEAESITSATLILTGDPMCETSAALARRPSQQSSRFARRGATGSSS